MNEDAVDAVGMAVSALFVPGDRPERFAKAAASGADLVIVDLEDAVAPDHKDAARRHVVAWLQGGGRAAVRVNASTEAEHEADLHAMASCRPGLLAVVVPKAEDRQALRAVHETTSAALVPIVESARGLAAIDRLTEAAGVVRLAFGHLDYAADLGAAPTREPMLHARSVIVQAARAAGLPPPLDGVTPGLDDTDRAGADAAYARDLGFGGKLLIHPTQVQPTHDAFAPTEEEVAWAHRVLDTAGSGAVKVDGAMADAPVLRRARSVLSRRRP